MIFAHSCHNHHHTIVIKIIIIIIAIIIIIIIIINTIVIIIIIQGVNFGGEQLNVSAIFEEIEEEVLVAVSDHHHDYDHRHDYQDLDRPHSSSYHNY